MLRFIVFFYLNLHINLGNVEEMFKKKIYLNLNTKVFEQS